MRFLPVGKEALLVELADLSQTLAMFSDLQKNPIPGVWESVPAAKTILLKFTPNQVSAVDLVNRIATRRPGNNTRHNDVLVLIPVRYKGEDLEEVARLLCMSTNEVIRRHCSTEWTVAFNGFAPGFGYLTGGDPCFSIPRRETPRTRVPAGAVALAGNFSAVYPKATPGGWQIIGETDLTMWDLSRSPPALLQPGYRVRFVDTDANEMPVTETKKSPEVHYAGEMNPLEKTDPLISHSGLSVINTGLQSLFQDLGRHAQAVNGVSVSGALDRRAFRTANRLVGNDVTEPALETVGGLVLQSHGDHVIAVTGAETALELVAPDGRRWPLSGYSPFALSDGDRLHIGFPVRGARCYVAVRGGFSVNTVLGSASTDTLAHLGPAPLRAGQELHTGATRLSSVADPELPPDNLPAAEDEVVLDIILGPRTDWFTKETPDLLQNQRWEVSPQSNRVGMRLTAGQPVKRTIVDELPSEGVIPGCIQVPPSGQPVVFLADHPQTGGYPVVGCVASHHLDLAGQIPPGAMVRFNVIHSDKEYFPSLPERTTG